MLISQIKLHQTTLSDPQLFSKSDSVEDIRASQLYKLLQKTSVDFLASNAERALKNLTQFSFSDLEIVSKSAQTVCAKLADKMRKKVLDEELPDVKIAVKGEIHSEVQNVGDLAGKEVLSRYLMEVMKGEEDQGVPFREGQGYLRAADVNWLQVHRESELRFGLQKDLLKVLFPEGFNLKDIELNGKDTFLENNSQDIVPISEQSEDKENYISGNVHVKGESRLMADKTGFYFSIQDNSSSDFISMVNKRPNKVDLQTWKQPKESITQIIQKKHLLKESKNSLHSVDKMMFQGTGRGKYRNDAIHRILRKRKQEISKSFSNPNNLIQESLLEEINADLGLPNDVLRKRVQPRPRWVRSGSNQKRRWPGTGEGLQEPTAQGEAVGRQGQGPRERRAGAPGHSLPEQKCCHIGTSEVGLETVLISAKKLIWLIRKAQQKKSDKSPSEDQLCGSTESTGPRNWSTRASRQPFAPLTKKPKGQKQPAICDTKDPK